MLVGFLLAFLSVSSPSRAFACSSDGGDPKTDLIVFIGTVAHISAAADPRNPLASYEKEITFDVESVGRGHAETEETLTAGFGGCYGKEDLQAGERYLVASPADRNSLWSAVAIGNDPPPDHYVWRHPDSTGWFEAHWRVMLVVVLITMALATSLVARRRRRTLRESAEVGKSAG